MKLSICLSVVLMVCFFPVSLLGINISGGMESFYTVSPGSDHSGEIKLVNPSDKTETVRIYLEDYLFYSDGTNRFPPPGTSKRSNAKWIKFSPEFLEIPGNGTGKIVYEIKVPKENGLSGSFWSMFMIEPVDEEDPIFGKNRQSGKPAVGLRTQLRYAYQIVTTINKTGEKKLRFLKNNLRYHEGKKILEVNVENIGSLYTRPEAWIELFTRSGSSIGKFKSSPKQILPECSVKYPYDLSNVASGTYTVLSVLDTGNSDLIGSKAEIELK